MGVQPGLGSPAAVPPESPELAAGTPKGSVSLQKSGWHPVVARPAQLKTRPLPRPDSPVAHCRGAKNNSLVAPPQTATPTPPPPLPHWAWSEATAPSSPQRGGKKTERKKERKGGAGGERGAGRGRGAQPYGCDFSAPRQTGRSAALGARPPPARPQAASLPPPSLSPLRRLVLSLALGVWAPHRAPGPRAARTPGSPRTGCGRGGPA